MEATLRKFHCVDSSGRKFSIITKGEDATDPKWLSKQNENRAKFGANGRDLPIVEIHEVEL